MIFFHECSKKLFGKQKVWQPYRCSTSDAESIWKVRLQYVSADPLPSHLLGVVWDEHSERFYHEISSIGKIYQGKWNSSMLANYCWLSKGTFLWESIQGHLQRWTLFNICSVNIDNVEYLSMSQKNSYIIERNGSFLNSAWKILQRLAKKSI